MKLHTIALQVKAPDDLAGWEIARIIDELIAVGYDDAMDSLELHESGDIDDPSIEVFNYLEIGSARVL